MAVAGLLAVPLQCFAHGGGLDAQGCHHDRKSGGYHCHRAQPVLVQVPADQTSAQAMRDLRQPTPAALAAPTCHVGPRGGTYTLTASGRKNYAGC
jgi:hypothetical protein